MNHELLGFVRRSEEAETTAQSASTAGSWLRPLVDGLRAGSLISRDLLREDYELVTDVQGIDLVRFGTRPADLLLRAVRPGHPELVGRVPGGVCGWASCGHGCCLWVDDAGLATVTSVTLWMRYLIRHYLGGGHALDGVVVARNRYTTETTAIRVRANQVDRIRLSGPDSRYRGHWDEWADPSPPPERRPASPPAARSAAVIDLASRRASR